jgi:hypothetical protein
MKLLLLFLLISSYTFAQVNENYFFAVINDKDGYVNVRKEKSVHSRVLKKLDNNTLIFVFVYDKAHDGNWIYVDNEGYIYNDRVKWIEELPKVAKGVEKKNAIHFSGKDIRVTLTSQKFDKSKHSFKYNKEYPDAIEKIDGKPFWGTDGEMPREEYKNIQIYINGKQVFIPKSAYDDLYETTFYTENNSVYYDKELDSYYIVATNSDGAGAYMVCWQIEKGVYKGRKIGIPF